MRLQMSFTFLILIFFGLRPRHIIEPSCYRGRNEGLLYRDVTLMVSRESGVQRFRAILMVRNTKDNDVYVLYLTCCGTSTLIGTAVSIYISTRTIVTLTYVLWYHYLL